MVSAWTLVLSLVAACAFHPTEGPWQVLFDRLTVNGCHSNPSRESRTLDLRLDEHSGFSWYQEDVRFRSCLLDGRDFTCEMTIEADVPYGSPSSSVEIDWMGHFGDEHLWGEEVHTVDCHDGTVDGCDETVDYPCENRRDTTGRPGTGDSGAL